MNINFVTQLASAHTGGVVDANSGLVKGAPPLLAYESGVQCVDDGALLCFEDALIDAASIRQRRPSVPELPRVPEVRRHRPDPATDPEQISMVQGSLVQGTEVTGSGCADESRLGRITESERALDCVPGAEIAGSPLSSVREAGRSHFAQLAAAVRMGQAAISRAPADGPSPATPAAPGSTAIAHDTATVPMKSNPGLPQASGVQSAPSSVAVASDVLGTLVTASAEMGQLTRATTAVPSAPLTEFKGRALGDSAPVGGHRPATWPHQVHQQAVALDGEAALAKSPGIGSYTVPLQAGETPEIHVEVHVTDEHASPPVSGAVGETTGRTTAGQPTRQDVPDQALPAVTGNSGPQAIKGQRVQPSVRLPEEITRPDELGHQSLESKESAVETERVAEGQNRTLWEQPQTAGQGSERSEARHPMDRSQSQMDETRNIAGGFGRQVSAQEHGRSTATTAAERPVISGESVVLTDSHDEAVAVPREDLGLNRPPVQEDAAARLGDLEKWHTQPHGTTVTARQVRSVYEVVRPFDLTSAAQDVPKQRAVTTSRDEASVALNGSRIAMLGESTSGRLDESRTAMLGESTSRRLDEPRIATAGESTSRRLDEPRIAASEESTSRRLDEPRIAASEESTSGRLDESRPAASTKPQVAPFDEPRMAEPRKAVATGTEDTPRATLRTETGAERVQNAQGSPQGQTSRALTSASIEAAQGSEEESPKPPTALDHSQLADAREPRFQPGVEAMGRAVEPVEPVEHRSVVGQIVSRVNLSAGPERSTITIGLKPERLGNVEVLVEAGRDGRILTSIRAETDEARKILRSSAHRLVQALKEQGLQVSEIRIGTVQTAQADSEGEGQRHQLGQGSSQDTGEAGFEMSDQGRFGQQGQERPHRFGPHVGWQGYALEALGPNDEPGVTNTGAGLLVGQLEYRA